MRGRPAKPLEIHKLHGTYRASRHSGAPNPNPGTPTCPEHLDDDARAEWRRLIPEMKATGTLAKCDRGTIAAYCQTVSRWAEAERQIQATGAVIKTATGEARVSPWVKIAETSLTLLRQFAIELGLTPSARTKIRCTPASKPDAFDTFLEGGIAKRNRQA